MLVAKSININELKNNIDETNMLDKSQKNFLENLLNIDSSFLHYSFGLGDHSSVNWDFIYTELKTYVIPIFLETDWTYTYSHTVFDETVFIVNITFSQEQKIADFLIGSTYENDNRTIFNQLEIYLTEKNGRLLKGVNNEFNRK
ncbi:hypothetical protein HMI01_26770 [Halolactibacillus miurensis]|uniref:Uncharacterized protein n=1 Tax=Halolactibacillus miurensis TaxID=306541 RepID=A0A1I6U323_9BACI|nr:hypothetical protein [Halolactibacillus miurensis]GEM05689.1 hypothetical protein HMI01_26770 [Halolactibacillus miurensis]SFS95812.1 hypothetical protein SAMN05421668_12127 [Halolactibacillus miurensis]